MKKRLRLIFSGLTLLLGVFIVAVSLMSVSPVVSSSGLSEHELYFDSKILPDHLAYPALMAYDRAKLNLSSDNDQVEVKVEYANRRLAYSKQLMEKEKMDLALTTFGKSHLYLISAAEQAKKLQASDAVKEYIAKALSYHRKEANKIKEKFNDSQRAEIDRLLELSETCMNDYQQFLN